MRTDLVGRVSRLFRHRPPAPRAPRRRRTLAVLIVVGALAAVAVPIAASSGATNRHWFIAERDGLGIQPGKIKHVWLIILENKSYDASFTGLNNNTYLWQTLPSQGVLLKNYYGTGHFSLDNYISLVSGQATQPDTQSDCPYYDSFTEATGASGAIGSTGSVGTNPDYGQAVSAAGPNAAAGTNGCVYPANVPTLFNQLDAAHVSWKGYAQDLGATDASGPVHATGGSTQPWLDCGAPYPSPGPTGATAQPNPGSANATDQYVPKHFPFPWFESILQSGDCNSAHIANLFDPTDGLYHDLQSEATTPAFSWISPNNCSDAHDAVCHGNNLSGGFSDPNTPNAPVNYTGGLYAADLFLEHVIPEIEASPAFKDGGLIDVTFDEAFPPFTYTGNSFANSTIVQPNAATRSRPTRAGETLLRPQRQLRADRPEHAAGDRRHGRRSSTRARVTTPTSTGRPTASPRPSRRSRQAPACSAAAATSRERDRHGARTGARRSDDHRQLDRRDRRRPRGHRHRHPGRRLRRRWSTRRRPATRQRPAGSSTRVVHAGRLLRRAARDDGAGQRHLARAPATPRDRPAVRRHRRRRTAAATRAAC